MPFSNREKLSAPHNVSFPSVVLQKIQEYGEKTAFYEDATGREITFNDFVINVRRLGAALQRQEINKGDVITICAPNCIEHPLIYYAASTIGALFHATKPAFHEKILVHQINTAETSILVTDTQFLPKMKAILEQCPSVKKIFITGSDSTSEHHTLMSLLSEEECEDVSVNDPRYDSRYVPHHVVFTSGTTGLPKAAKLSHYACLYTMLQLDHEKFRVSQPNDVTVVIIPFSHVIGQLILMAQHLYSGTKSILVPTGLEFDVYMKAIEKYKADVVWGNTPVVNRLATTSGTAAYDLSSVRALMFGGCAIREGMFNRFRKTYPSIKMVNQIYGLTETGIVTFNVTANKPLSSGLLIPGAEAKFLDHVTNKEVEPNNMGELYIRTETMMLGYFNNDGMSGTLGDDEGWTSTGDAGYYDEEGYFYIVDRMTQLIRHKEEYVYPSIIDNILLNHPGVDDVATIAVKRSVVGDVPYCFIVSSDRSDAFEDVVRQTLSERIDPSLASHVEIGFIEEIPRTLGGKYHIEQLREWTETTKKHPH